MDHTERAPDAELTHRVIGCFLVAYRGVGFGYPEAVYSAALEVLFRDAGLRARREHVMDVTFRGVSLGRFRLDYLVEDSLIRELKAGHHMPPGSKAQLLTYLRMAKKQVGLLLLFGPSPEIVRVTL